MIFPGPIYQIKTTTFMDHKWKTLWKSIKSRLANTNRKEIIKKNQWRKWKSMLTRRLCRELERRRLQAKKDLESGLTN